MPSGAAYPGTQAVLRALALLKSFTDDRPELGLAELVQAVHLNKTTAYRLLTALEQEGLVIRNHQTDTYRLGPEMIAMGGRASRANDVRRVSHAELEKLAGQTGETATLEILSEAQVLTLDEVAGSYLMSVAQDIGSRWPLHATSTGKALLAHLPEMELEALLRRPLTSFTSKTLTEPASLRRQLAQIRRQGYAIADEELEVGFVAVGAPVFNHNGEVVAAISLGGPNARLTAQKRPALAALVKEAAGRISARLGYSSKP
jgi:DNA-binding IclR family transcriptional regulator